MARKTKQVGRGTFLCHHVGRTWYERNVADTMADAVKARMPFTVQPPVGPWELCPSFCPGKSRVFRVED